jgi:hypothetical protein
MTTEMSAWKALQEHFEREKNPSILSLCQDPSRFRDFSASFGSGAHEILLDFSKNLLLKSTFELLINLAKESKVHSLTDGGRLKNGGKKCLTDRQSIQRNNGKFYYFASFTHATHSYVDLYFMSLSETYPQLLFLLMVLMSCRA